VIQIEDAFLERYLPLLKPTAFSLYLLLQHYRERVPSLQQLADCLGKTLPTVLVALEKLESEKLVRRLTQKRFVPTKYWVKTQTLPVLKNFSDLLFFSSSLRIIRESILENTVYRNRRVSGLLLESDKNKQLLTNLVKHGLRTQDDVLAYCKWWVARKRHLRFSMGLLCCDSMLEEYVRTQRHTFSTVKKTPEERTKQESRRLYLLKEMVQDVKQKKQRGEVLTAEDRAVVQKAREQGLIGKGSKS